MLSYLQRSIPIAAASSPTSAKTLRVFLLL